MNRYIVALLSMLSIASFSPPKAAAQTSLAALVGYGVDFEDGDLNPFGFTVGGRIGHTLPMKLYLGATGVFHVGETVESLGVESTGRMLQFGVELGYDAQLSRVVVLRPYGGLGANVLLSTVRYSSVFFSAEDKDSATDLYLNVGAALLYYVSQDVFIGGDVRSTNVLTDDEALNGIVFLGTVGASF